MAKMLAINTFKRVGYDYSFIQLQRLDWQKLIHVTSSVNHLGHESKAMYNYWFVPKLQKNKSNIVFNGNSIIVFNPCTRYVLETDCSSTV